MPDLELQGKIVLHADTSPAEQEVAGNAKKVAAPITPAVAGAFMDGIKAVAQSFKSTGVSAMAGMANRVGGNAAGGAVSSVLNYASKGAGAGGAAAGVVGGISIGVGIAAAITAAIVAAAVAFKNLTSKVIDFGRSLSDMSGKMALAFNKFDIQMAIFRKRLGDDLAPAMQTLLQSVNDLATTAMPLIEGIVKGLAGASSSIIDFANGLTGNHGAAERTQTRSMQMQILGADMFNRAMFAITGANEYLDNMTLLEDQQVQLQARLVDQAEKAALNGAKDAGFSGFSDHILNAGSLQDRYNRRLQAAGTQIRDGRETQHDMFGANFSIGADDSAHWTLNDKGRNAGNRFSQ